MFILKMSVVFNLNLSTGRALKSLSQYDNHLILPLKCFQISIFPFHFYGKVITKFIF